MWQKEDSVIADNSMDTSKGGFLDTTANTSGDGTYTKSTSGYQRGQNCVPVMIAHIKRYGEDLEIWGMPVKLVTLVAILRECESVSTKVTFMLEDETGTIKGVKWLESSSQDFQCPVSLNAYARIHGMIRNQNNENFIFVVGIQPLEHLNELLAHLMEVTLVTLEGQKRVEQVAQGDNTFIGNSSKPVRDFDAGLTKEQEIIYDIIKNNCSEEGAERNFIKSRAPAYMQMQVDALLTFLADEGHIYTTVTDDHFKSI